MATGGVGPGGQWVERADTPAGGLLGAMAALVSAEGSMTVNGRDGLGRATSYTDASGTTYTITYGAFGPSTISGGGRTRTIAYSAAGLITGYTAS